MLNRTIKRRRRAPNYGRNIVDTALGLHVGGMRPGAIVRELQDRLPEEERLPDERTVRTWVRRWKSDQSGPWVFDDEQTDPFVLLPLLADLIDTTHGVVSSFTKDEARVLSRLVKAVPDMPPLAMYHWAVAFVAARDSEPVDPLLHYLAFAPWRDVGERYLDTFFKHNIEETRQFAGDSDWLKRQLKAGFLSLDND